MVNGQRIRSSTTYAASGSAPKLNSAVCFASIFPIPSSNKQVTSLQHPAFLFLYVIDNTDCLGN
uniref:Uncharacterized protein n=1 Tax=Parascaris univalens TaxID=6257 RepID=A0A915B3S8_PARUN